MAAGRLPGPGSGIGPCAGDCHHTDCAATRELAASACTYCDKEIGYETPFYRLEAGNYVHQQCHEIVVLRRQETERGATS